MDKKLENYIEGKYRDLQDYSSINYEYLDFYSYITHDKLKDIICTMHYNFISLFKNMNTLLPSGDFERHYGADHSRRLIKTIEITLSLYHILKGTEYSFEIDKYYLGIINKCRSFLKESGGSTVPMHMDSIELYYTIPIFKQTSIIEMTRGTEKFFYDLKQIGYGSYAYVYKYKDKIYNKFFALKRAKKELDEKELSRFKQEFIETREFSSPYIIEVYSYNDEKNEYVMEYVDYTLDEYIKKNNNKIDTAKRKTIVLQIIKAFNYIHSKNRLHRDVSPKNILIKEYDDTIVVKISDFGLVKIPESSLTTKSTEIKGYFNDPSLILDGFHNYDMCHETYALTRIIYFVMTGKTNVYEVSNKKLEEFVKKGLNPDKSKRFQNTSEMLKEIKNL